MTQMEHAIATLFLGEFESAVISNGYPRYLIDLAAAAIVVALNKQRAMVAELEAENWRLKKQLAGEFP